MEEQDERSNGRNSHETSCLQFHKTPQKRSLSNYVDSIREGLKKIGGCQDVHEVEVTKPKRNKKHNQSKYDSQLVSEDKNDNRDDNSRNKNSDKKKQEITDLQQSGFDEFHSSVPKIDSMKRTLSWVYHSKLESGSKISLSVLPMRGTLLPTRYSTVGRYCDDRIILSVSSCESARGTHGRGTPPVMDPNTPRLDELFQQLQQKQEREARRQIIASGEQHLLSFNLLDVYSHQVAGMPIGTTPEILPFMAPSHVPRTPKLTKKSKLQTSQNRTFPSTHEVSRYVCRWLSCSKRFHSAEELFSHVDQCHIQAYKTINTPGDNSKYVITCKWNNCNHICHARYKLLLHVHNRHYKEIPHSTVSKNNNYSGTSLL